MALALGAAGCAIGTANVRPMLPQAPIAEGGGKCQVAASQSSPLVTEWPASEKANLEALMRGGAVAVAYSGCSMRVLPQCRLRGGYGWQRTTPATDKLEINDADDLYAKLPLGAASLEGELKRSGKLTVETVVAGQLKLDGIGPNDVPADGPCAQATHVVGALSIGAFELSAAGETTASLDASVKVVEAKGERSRSAGRLRSAGDFNACSSGTDGSPAPNCASPIQVFLWALPGRGVAEEGPPGTIKVDFISGNPSSRWDVYSDDQVICTTPCERWVRPERPIMLRAREEAFMAAPDRVQVTNLLDQAAAGTVQLQAHPTARGQLAAGITFTSLSGMAVLTGISLAGVGCSMSDHAGMCNAGLITLGAGGVALAGSIWMITDSMPRAQVIAGPGMIAGTF
jgi:hypothetical protein